MPRKNSVRSLLLIAFLSFNCAKQPIAVSPPLITGKNIDTTATITPIGDLPMNMIATADGRFGIICGMGYEQSIYAIETKSAKLVSKVDFRNKIHAATTAPGGEEAAFDLPVDSAQSNGVYYGLVIATNGNIYAAQGSHDSIAILNLSDGGILSMKDSIPTKKSDFPAGLATDQHNHLL